MDKEEWTQRWEKRRDVGTFRAEFTESQLERLNAIREIATNDSISDVELDKRIIGFSISLMKHNSYRPEYSIIKYFCAVLGWNTLERRWARPADYTPNLSAIEFCMRVIALEHTFPRSIRDNYDFDMDPETPGQTFLRFHHEFLVATEDVTPFASIHRLRNYGIAAGQDAKGIDKLRFIDDGKAVIWGGATFEVEAWKKMVNELIVRLEVLISRRLLYRDTDELREIDIDTIVDLESHPAKDYYFAESTPDYEAVAVDTVMNAMRETPEGLDRLQEPDENGKAQFTSKFKELYTEADEEFRKLLLLVITFACGMAGRGMETLSLRFRNTEKALRNLFVLDGQLAIITTYHKSEAMTGHAKVSHSSYLS
jgi:hypothetical protein